MNKLFFYVCDAGHKVTAPWPLTECPSFLRGAAEMRDLAERAYQKAMERLWRD